MIHNDLMSFLDPPFVTNWRELKNKGKKNSADVQCELNFEYFTMVLICVLILFYYHTTKCQGQRSQ